jgi:hypothetical protein
MSYDKDKQWDEIVKTLQQKARALMNALREAKAAQEEWNSFRDGRSDAVLTTYFDSVAGGRPGTVEADVTELKQAHTSFKDAFDFCDNVASPVQGDRFADWRKFT